MDMNKLYSVQYLNYTSGSCTIVGLFRDENIAKELQKSKNEELKAKDGNSLPGGYYVVNPLYTDF
jgi:hypothetical protein